MTSARLEAMRCGTCHPEHRGRDRLAAFAAVGCVQCHADPAATTPGTTVRRVSDFGDDHPEFRVQLATGIDIADFRTRTLERVEWRSDLEERSGLAFNHLRHVGQPVPNPATRTTANLRCDACHRRAADAGNFEPIAFEEHCQTCHSLTFDRRFPDRHALHGDAEEMRADLAGFYANLALREDPVMPPSLRRGRPGSAPAPAQQRATLAWVEGQVAHAIHRLLEAENAVCGRCHEMLGHAGDGGARVAPVLVTPTWLPKAHFTHGTHWSLPCGTCHAAAAVYDAGFAREHPEAAGSARPAWSSSGIYELVALEALPEGLSASATSHDVLVPGIEGCRECHTGAAGRPPRASTSPVASSWLGSECTLCHPFHRRDLGPMRGPTIAEAR